ncbi:hypothetical protein ACET4I_13040 [Pseudomonas aeruginosa]
MRGTEGPQRRRDPRPGRVRPGQPVGHQFHRGNAAGQHHQPPSRTDPLHQRRSPRDHRAQLAADPEPGAQRRAVAVLPDRRRASRIGFISPHSNNFCGDCNRVRVTAEGKLVLCLGHEGALDLRELLRSHPGDRERLSAALVAALNLKPERHHFDAQEQVQVLRFMSMTGG